MVWGEKKEKPLGCRAGCAVLFTACFFLIHMLHGASHASSMHNLYTIGVHATVEFSDAISALLLQVNERKFEKSCKTDSAP